MGLPAARITDMHVCPMVTAVVPHVGGPVVGPCAVTVLMRPSGGPDRRYAGLRRPARRHCHG
jgi:hypothetical protein